MNYREFTVQYALRNRKPNSHPDRREIRFSWRFIFYRFFLPVHLKSTTWRSVFAESTFSVTTDAKPAEAECISMNGLQF